LARPDRISVLQKLRERGARRLDDCVLELFWQVGEGHVAVDRLHVPEQLVGESPGRALQGLDRFHHGREDDRLHHFIRWPLHSRGAPAVD
jgi:hypothetical protein